MERGFRLVAASRFCICLKPPCWNPPATPPNGTQCARHYVLSALFHPLTPGRLLVCLHLRIIDACRDAILGPAMSWVLIFGARASWARTQELAISHPDAMPPGLLPVSVCWLLAADNNNSGELRAGWEMPLICWSCQLSRSEMKWKSHALMAEMLLPGGRESCGSTEPLHTTSTHPMAPWTRWFTLVNGGFFRSFRQLQSEMGEKTKADSK